MTTARADLRILDGIVGWVSDQAVADRLHELRHHHAVEYLHLDVHDVDRSRLRATSDAGTDYAIVLPRGSALADGAVLVLEPDRAVVVRAGAPRTMTLRANDIGAALRLGFLAGHLHWKADQRDDTVVVHLESPESDYTSRIVELLESGRVRRPPTAFGTVYVVGGGFDDAMTALSPDLESLSVLTGDRRVYLAVSDLPNQAGWAVRIAGSDGGTLRATIAAVTDLIEAGSQAMPTFTRDVRCEGEQPASCSSAVHQK